MFQGILLWILSIATVVLHPFHVSICDIEYQADKKTLEISSRMFMDDLEVALSQRTNVENYFDSRDKSLINNDLSHFLEENFKLWIEDRQMEATVLGYEIEDDVVWCYLEVEKVRQLNSITIEYAVLFDVFDDQFNLVHVKRSGTTKSLRFVKSQTSGTITF